jgi:hypothetical protein
MSKIVESLKHINDPEDNESQIEFVTVIAMTDLVHINMLPRGTFRDQEILRIGKAIISDLNELLPDTYERI